MNSKDMLLFVGTLYVNENEFPESIDSIFRQSYKHYDHYVFRNLPNKEAHVALFKSFLEKTNEYDVLVKVDADMVLLNTSIFANIVDVFKQKDWVQILSIAVHDFFSDRLIWGLNTYRNTVRWDLDSENLFVDIPNTPIDNYFFDDHILAPAAIHCKNPSPYQAFHYGIHRGLKVIQTNRVEKRSSSSKSHFRNLELTWLNFLSKKDERLGLAVLGAELVYAGKFNVNDLDYSNPNISIELSKYISMDSKKLLGLINRIRLLNFGYFQGDRRRKMICWSNSGIPGMIRRSVIFKI